MAQAGGLNVESAQGLINKAKKVVKVIPPSKLKSMIDEDEDFYLLDIREPDQIGHGEIFHLDQIRITRGYLEFKIENLVKDKGAPIIVYCCTGKRGILAAKTLQDMGYTNVMSLDGGIRKWVEDGYPLDTVYGEMVFNK
jgi:rhodanese-related sulfurtransferase